MKANKFLIGLPYAALMARSAAGELVQVVTEDGHVFKGQ
jgi:hypothetical protein